MDTAEANLSKLLSAAGPEANIVVNGKLVQGKLTTHMARVMEWKARFEAMPESATEDEWAILGAAMQADLNSIEPASQNS